MTLDEGTKVIFEAFGQTPASNNHCFCALTGRGTNLGQNRKQPKPLSGRVFGKIRVRPATVSAEAPATGANWPKRILLKNMVKTKLRAVLGDDGHPKTTKKNRNDFG